MRRTLQLPACEIDLPRGLVLRDGAELRLTSQERELLAYLAARPGEQVPREDLLVAVWGYQRGVASRAVDHAVSRLRQKIEQDPRDPVVLRSAYGQGYSLTLPEAAPAAAPPRRAPGFSLPDDRFLGREADLEALRRALDAPGLLGLVGPPGVGKSRLAAELGWRLAEEGQSVCFVAAAACVDAAGFVGALCRGLGPSRPGSQGDFEALIEAAAGLGPALLIVDNVEQLGAIAGQVLQDLTAGAPALRLLHTSRAPTEAPAERLYRLSPLAVPAAMELYEDRARRVQAGFVATGPVRPSVERLVRTLDGLPLAVEVAGAWADLRSPARLLELIEQGRALMERDGVRSLSSAFSLSWSLLPEALRPDLLRLTVFGSAFDLDAAEAVLGPQAAGALSALVARSWLLREVDPLDRQPRFRLLQVTRAHLVERAQAEPPLIAAASQAHAEHYLARARRLTGALRAEAGASTLLQLSRELDQLRLVAARSGAARPARCVEATLAMDAVLRRRGPLGLRFAQLEAAVEVLPRLDDAPLQEALLAAWGDAGRQLGRLTLVERGLSTRAAGAPTRAVLARVALEQGAYALALDHVQGALQIAGPADRAELLYLRGLVHYAQRAYAEGERCFVLALSANEDQPDAAQRATLLGILGSAAMALGRLDEASARFTEAEDLHSRLENALEAALMRTNLAQAAYRSGRRRASRDLYDQAIAELSALGARRLVGLAQTNAGDVAREEGDLAAAHRLLGAAAANLRAVGALRLLAYALTNLASLHLEEGAPERAEPVFDEVLPLCERIGDRSLFVYNLLCRALARLGRGDSAGAVDLQTAAAEPALSEPVREAREVALGRVEDDARSPEARFVAQLRRRVKP